MIGEGNNGGVIKIGIKLRTLSLPGCLGLMLDLGMAKHRLSAQDPSIKRHSLKILIKFIKIYKNMPLIYTVYSHETHSHIVKRNP